MEKLQRQNENLLKQLEFVNSENNKLSSLQIENGHNNEIFQSRNKEVKKLTQQLNTSEAELKRCQEELNKKSEIIQRLTEQ